MTGIPTKYANTQFRSRLEAKWARFFDLVGWQWEYEPFDLNGWIPDFALTGENETVLVEVKPIADLRDPAAIAAQCKAERAVETFRREITASDARGPGPGGIPEALLLGFTWPKCETSNTRGVGWLCDWCSTQYNDNDEIEVPPVWAVAAFYHGSAGWGFHHEYGSWHNRIGGGEYAKRGTFADAPINLWREAGNTVQWRAP